MISSRTNIKLLIALGVLFMATPFAYSRPGNSEVREAVRDAQQYQKNARDSEPYGRSHEHHSPDHSSRSEPSRKSGRMSPEERRALRQQINEAGQDLYYRRR